MALEDGTGVLEVLFGVGFGGGDTLKRLVQNADNPPLFGERGDANLEQTLSLNARKFYSLNRRSCASTKFRIAKAQVASRKETLMAKGIFGSMEQMPRRSHR